VVRYVTGRVVSFVPTAVAVMLITFCLGYLGPGDPVRIMMGENWQDQATYLRLRHAYGFDRPFAVQFADYAGKVVRGDLGKSLTVRRNQPVAALIRTTLPVSAQLGAAALLISILVGVPLGILAAARQNSWLDNLIVSTFIGLSSIPVFVLIPITLIIFVLNFHWIDASSSWKGLFSKQAILPAAILAIPPTLVIVRQTRMGVVETLSQEYVRTARAKGLGELGVIRGHIVRNSMTPVVTTAGLIFGSLITGSLFIETFFGIPGFGQMAYQALRARDYPLLMGCTLVGATVVMLANLLVDLLYGVMDPRVRLTGGGRT
jgi:ABC-type dipeptide/oligopeptide/nickel transport system permease component